MMVMNIYGRLGLNPDTIDREDFVAKISLWMPSSTKIKHEIVATANNELR